MREEEPSETGPKRFNHKSQTEMAFDLNGRGSSAINQIKKQTVLVQYRFSIRFVKNQCLKKNRAKPDINGSITKVKPGMA